MTKKLSRKREPITDAREADIIEIVNSWDAALMKFNREALVRAVISQLNFVVTRQGLMKRQKIRKAFEARDQEISLGQVKQVPKEPIEDMYVRRVQALQDGLEEANKTISNFQEMFVRYRYNARQLGIPSEKLEAPIPPRVSIEGSRG